MPDITVESVSKVYADGTEAVDNVSMRIPEGELLVLVGPSGCGKTTLLRMVAGLEEVTSGTIRIGERDITHVSPKNRDVAMVFQNYALYPHMTVRQNIAYALRFRKIGKRESAERVAAAARTLGLTDQLEKRPSELSGGQRQRVAMGRAMVREPQAFLMDEPLSNLDAKLRVHMRTEIARLQRDVGVTMIYVTHDQTEAMTLGDRVAVLRDGVVRQIDRPSVLYAHPADLAVATFIGTPAMNVALAEVGLDGEDVVLSIGASELRLGPEQADRWPDLRAHADGQLVVGVRPEALTEVAKRGEGSSEASFGGTVEFREDLGSDTYLYVAIDGVEQLPEGVRDLCIDGGVEQDVETEIAAAPFRRFIARPTSGATVSDREQVDIGFDLAALHFFDAQTGVALPAAGQADSLLGLVHAPATGGDDDGAAETVG